MPQAEAAGVRQIPYTTTVELALAGGGLDVDQQQEPKDEVVKIRAAVTPGSPG